MTDQTPFDELVEALELEDFAEEEQEQMLLDLNELIAKGTMLRLIQRMDEPTQADFGVLMDGDPTPQAVEAFLAERVPDAGAAVTETVTQLRDDILAVTKS